jgi:hypothetical protein
MFPKPPSLANSRADRSRALLKVTPFVLPG